MYDKTDKTPWGEGTPHPYASFIANILLFYIDREEGNFPQEYFVYSIIVISIDQILLFPQCNKIFLVKFLFHSLFFVVL